MNSFFSFSTSSSTPSGLSSNPGDPQNVMHIVAQHHSQFRSRSSKRVMAEMTEQQDAHEFFSAMIDVLSLETLGEANFISGEGLASCAGFLGPEAEELVYTNFRCRLNSVCHNSPLLKSDNSENCAVWRKHGTDNSARVCKNGTEEKWESVRTSHSYSNSLLSATSCNCELQEEKKNEETRDGKLNQRAHFIGNNKNEGNLTDQSQEISVTSITPTLKLHHDSENSKLKTVTTTNSFAVSSIQHPFDGWLGSTIKCSSCLHIRPIRITPFLDLSLPVAADQSSSLYLLEDFLAIEYATPERVSDVQCVSCAIGVKMRELEEEEWMIRSAIANIHRRSKGQKNMHQQQHQMINVSDCSGANSEKFEKESSDIGGLIKESQQISTKIAMLKNLDPDADDENDETKKESGTRPIEELVLSIISEHGAKNKLPQIIPLQGDAYKATLIMRPPKVLCIHVQRRHYDMRCQRMVKVMRHVEFPEVLDISMCCAYAKNSLEQLSSSLATVASERKRLADDNSSFRKKVPYKLMSVIEHKGNASGGHYQTYRRINWDLDTSIQSNKQQQKEWVLVSDESVSPRTWSDVKRCQAYMLFYLALL